MIFSLSNTEKEIMAVFWKKRCWMSGADFWNYFTEQGKSLKRQTVNTYLTRMTEKGLLIKNKTKYMYAYTEAEFEEKRADEIICTIYNGSLKNFLTAFTGNKNISHEEARALRDYLDEIT